MWITVKLDIDIETMYNRAMEDETWEVSQIEANSTKELADSETGGTYTIRAYQGRFPIIPLVLPDPQELWGAHEQRIRTSLWGDGWEQVADPRVVMHDQEFTFFIPCKPRPGQVVLEKAHNLREYANPGSRK